MLYCMNDKRDQSEFGFSFIDVDFFQLTHIQQFFTNDFLCVHYHIGQISAQIIELKPAFALKLFVIPVNIIWYKYS